MHASGESERAMLANALDQLGSDDAVLLDRGDPATWLIHLFNLRGIRFIVRPRTQRAA